MTTPELDQDFKRSRRFALIGVGVVAALCAAIALLFGSGSARPTGAMIAILAIVFGFVFGVLVLQRRDLERAQARGARPADALLEELAVKPIDQAAIAAASGRVWSTARGSLRSAAILLVLIFCAVVPWQLFTAYWSIVVFVPIIVGYAGFLAVRAVGAGGHLDQAYEDSAAVLEPLGLRLSQRPRVVVRRRLGGPGAQAGVEGVLAYEGDRHGRRVAIRIEGSRASTALSGPTSAFRAEAKDRRLQAAAGTPAEVVEVLARLDASPDWEDVEVAGGAEGIVVARTHDGGVHWMRDLWLAERLADVLAPRHRG